MIQWIVYDLTLEGFRYVWLDATAPAPTLSPAGNPVQANSVAPLTKIKRARLAVRNFPHPGGLVTADTSHQGFTVTLPSLDDIVVGHYVLLYHKYGSHTLTVAVPSGVTLNGTTDGTYESSSSEMILCKATTTGWDRIIDLSTEEVTESEVVPGPYDAHDTKILLTEEYTEERVVNVSSLYPVHTFTTNLSELPAGTYRVEAKIVYIASGSGKGRLTLNDVPILGGYDVSLPESWLDDEEAYYKIDDVVTLTSPITTPVLQLSMMSKKSGQKTTRVKWTRLILEEL